MRRNRRFMVGLLAVAALAISVSLEAAAQKTTLEIHGGTILVNGNKVPANQLPNSLDIEGLSMRLSFDGVEQPVVQIGRHSYRITENRLEEVDSSEADDRVVVSGNLEAPAAVYDGRTEEGWYRVGFADRMTKKKMEALQSQAQEMQQLSEEIRRERSADASRVAEELQKQAEAAAKMAADLPRLQVVNYWDDVRQKDAELYSRLVREWELEASIQDVVRRYRLSPDAQQRQAWLSELRGLLDQAFDLKQQNRGREIDQISSELQALYRRMQEREAARQLIIERRLQELVGDH